MLLLLVFAAARTAVVLTDGSDREHQRDLGERPRLGVYKRT